MHKFVLKLVSKDVMSKFKCDFIYILVDLWPFCNIVKKSGSK